MIHLINISRKYQDGSREIVALNHVDLVIPAGAFVALLGSSGSGKSTLLHLAAGLEPPTAGKVLVNGMDLAGLSDRELTAFRRTQIGFVFQFFHLLPSLSLFENLTLPAELARIPRTRARERARALLAAVGLENRASTFPERLSGGEQQRAAVARALMLRPPVILADEPTGTLDSANGSKVLDLLVALSRQHKVTLVVATHSPLLAASADRQIELQDGRVISDSNPAAPRQPDPPAAGAFLKTADVPT